jgi:hypothetical protein
MRRWISMTGACTLVSWCTPENGKWKECSSNEDTEEEKEEKKRPGTKTRPLGGLAGSGGYEVAGVSARILAFWPLEYRNSMPLCCANRTLGYGSFL